jgi:uncharacterized membrane protein YidH (DUF202 family)
VGGGAVGSERDGLQVTGYRLQVAGYRVQRSGRGRILLEGGPADAAAGFFHAGKFIAERGNALKAATLVGILLIIVGVIGFAVGGISFTHEKKDVDMGPVQIQHKQTRTVPISPILSTVALIGGIGLVVVGARS